MISLPILHRISVTRALLLGTVAVMAWKQPLRPMVFVGESMTPTYRSGEFALTVPAKGDLKIGDIVIIDRPNGTIVKRVASLPGDQIVQMRAGSDWIDGSNLRRSFVLDSPFGRLYTIPKGYVYVLGDNKEGSTDSRDFGPVPISSISRKILNPREQVELPAFHSNRMMYVPRHHRTIPERKSKLEAYFDQVPSDALWPGT